MNILRTLTKNNKEYAVRLLDNEDAGEVDRYFDLYYEAFGVRPHLDKTWFNWFNNLNPLGKCNNYILVDLEKNKIAGTYGLSKIMTINSGEKMLSGLGVNGMVGKDYRRQGLYADLMQIALSAENTTSFYYSFPHSSNIGTIKGHKNAKWKSLKKLFFYEKRNLERFSSLNSIELDSFDALKEIDFHLFQKSKHVFFYRSAEWLAWRFLERPHKKYNIIATFDKSSDITGYMVLGYYHNANNIIRCQIVDYGAQNSASLDDMIKKAQSIALDNNAQIIDLIMDQYSGDLPVFLTGGYSNTDESYEMFTFSKNEEIVVPVEIKTVLGDFDAV